MTLSISTQQEEYQGHHYGDDISISGWENRGEWKNSGHGNTWHTDTGRTLTILKAQHNTEESETVVREG